MPDFERITDKLNEDFAKTPEQKCYAKGYVRGKSRARWEVLTIFVVIYFGFAAIGFYSKGHETFFHAHKTDAEKQLLILQIEERKLQIELMKQQQR